MTTPTPLTPQARGALKEFDVSTLAPLHMTPADVKVRASDSWVRTPTTLSFVPDLAPFANCTTLLGEDPSGRWFGQLDSWVVVMTSMSGLPAGGGEAIDLTPSKAVELLRAWTGLPVTELADLLGVARRSLYHWSTGVARPRHEGRLFGVVRAIQPLAQTWQTWELRDWLSTDEIKTLVQTASTPELSRQVDAAVRSGATSRLRLASTGLHEEVQPLELAAISRHLASIGQPRLPRPRAVPYEPRELTDSPQIEGE
jgi:hypothetical protein